VPAYLTGLYQWGLRFGMQFNQCLLEESEFKRFDAIVMASGMGVKRFAPLKALPIYPMKGQVLKIAWPHNLPPLPCSLISEGFIVMEKEGKSCLAGATFERKFEDANPDPSIASPLIKEKIISFFPSLKDAPILDCKAGIRAIALNNGPPLLGKVLNNIWYITGLGAKGLLYHGHLGDLLAKAILANDPSLLTKYFNESGLM
jgi:glycine/D-amino acid oxidase-like deaminating enzyme